MFSPIHSQITLQILSEEVSFEPRIDSLETAAGSMIAMSGPWEMKRQGLMKG